MPTTISIRFLTGRAHLHPWDTHHSEGRIDWPPTPWRLLRALVAVAGRGLTTLPRWDDEPPERHAPEAPFAGATSLSKRGVPPEARGKLSLSKARGCLTLKAPLSDAEAADWTRANPSPQFATALVNLRRIIALPDPVAMVDVAGDEIPLSSLASLLAAFAPAPEIWLPRTGIGHTRHFFTIHDSGVTKTTGSAVFDTFAVLDKTQPICFVWPLLDLSSKQETDLQLLLARLGYFGRAESWCLAELCNRAFVHAIDNRTHWRCICWEDGSPEARRSLGREHRDFTLERRLAPLSLKGNGDDTTLRAEARRLFPSLFERHRPKPTEEALQSFVGALEREKEDVLLIRCLLRESGEDMKDGLERPIGTRWVHYAVPREIYNLPLPSPRRTNLIREEVHVVRYVLNTATTHRPVLPPLTDALLVGEHFRCALMVRHQAPSENFSGKTAGGRRLEGHQHAFFLPEDEDLDGFIDHVTVWCPRGFTASELRALRSLAQLPQRGGRPHLLVTPTRVAAQTDCGDLPLFQQALRFQSVTPYVPARHAFRESGRLREDELPDRQLARDILMRRQVLGNSASLILSMTFLGEKIDTPSGHAVYRNGVIRLDGRRQLIRCLDFVQHRRMKERRTGRLDHGQLGGSWVIELSELIRGPLALGYGCHFGLGQFRPAGKDEG